MSRDDITARETFVLCFKSNENVITNQQLKLTLGIGNRPQDGGMIPKRDSCSSHAFDKQVSAVTF